MDGGGAGGAIVAVAGKHDGDGARAGRGGQRAEQQVGGGPVRRAVAGLDQRDPAVRSDQGVVAGRGHQDVAGQERIPVAGRGDGQRDR